MKLLSGPKLLTNTYELNFNGKINYCDEIYNLFNKISPVLASDIKIKEDNDLSISLTHHTALAGKETDLVLLYLTAVYYDCNVNIYANDRLKYILKIIDGYVKKIEWAIMN